MTFLAQICTTMARYRMLAPGDHVGIAVSGGADSICLLHVLFELRSRFDLHLAVIHVDHNLRGPQSQADAQFVHKSAQQLGLPFHLRTLDLAATPGNLEQEGRRARYRFFQDLIRDGVIQKVALGHTRSDQAETVLFRFLRGAASGGLSAIRPVTNSGIIRPLLQVTRSQVVDWLTQHDLPWCEDATNQDSAFARNRIRHHLLPQLQAEWNPQLPAILAQTADWALAEDEYWREELPRLTENWVRFVKSGVILDAGRLTALPIAAARRVIRDVIERVKADLLGVDFAHIEAILHLAARQEGDGKVQIPGMEVVRSFNWVRFAKCSAEEPFAPICFVPGTDPLPSNGPLRFVLGSNERIYTIDGVYNEDRKALDWDKVCREVERQPGAALTIRTWRPGDQYQRRGRAGMEKLKALFREHRIPSWERPNWPVLAVGHAVAWVGEFGPAAEFAVDESSRTVLSIHWNRQS